MVTSKSERPHESRIGNTPNSLTILPTRSWTTSIKTINMPPRHFERILITRTSPFKLKRSTSPDPNQLSLKLEQQNLSKRSRTIKRNITPMSMQSVQSAESLEMMFGSIDRLDQPDQPADARPHPPQSRQPEAEQGANMRHLMSAPRRPRVVATPIQTYQPQVASRPSSKG